MQVFDDTNDDFEELADSNEDFGDYEVICASEMQSIPAPEEKPASRLGQGAQFMMKQTSKLLGSLWATR